MQTLTGKIEQLTTNNPHHDLGLKSLKEKTKSLNTVEPYYELMPNQSAVVFSDFEKGIEISLAVGISDEDDLTSSAFMAMALMQRIEKDPEFMEKVMELFDLNPEK